MKLDLQYAAVFLLCAVVLSALGQWVIAAVPAFFFGLAMANYVHDRWM